MRWKGMGVAINPGRDFLSQFHAQGLHIRDIDAVIVTSDRPDSYEDVPEIYALNYQTNKLSQELKIIHYYLHQHAFQALSGVLKPHFKQERHNLHSLELFLDSPELEKIELSREIQLHYFRLRSSGERAVKKFSAPRILKAPPRCRFSHLK